VESHRSSSPSDCISWTQKLNPRVALMSGRMRLRSDIRIAMQLDKVFGLAS
jgi:hypothetical protein